MKLSKRLKAIVCCIPKSDILVDIGTDHAFIPIEVVKKKLSNKVIASDIKEGPINVARNNILKYSVSNNIELRIGCGLEKINIEELDTVIIAGVGGILISEILQKDFSKAKLIDNLIVQPMNSTDVARKWFYNNGFDIVDEILVNEDKRIYSILTAKYDGKVRIFEEKYYHIGKRLIEKKDFLLNDYIDRVLYINNKKLKSLKNSHNFKDRFDQIDKLVFEICKLKN